MRSKTLDYQRQAAQAADCIKQNNIGVALRHMQGLPRPYQVEAFEGLSIHQKARALPGLPPALAADLLEEFSDYEAVKVARRLEREELAPILDEMVPHEAADLLGDLDNEAAAQLLGMMENSEEVASLLDYLDDSAGGRMTPEFLALPEQTRVEKALETLRDWKPRSDEVHYVFVLAEDRRLVGVIGPFDLLRANPEQTLGQAARRDPVSVEVQEDQETAARLMIKHALGALPVVNGRGELVGVISYASAMQTLEEETTEDLYEKSAMGGGGSEHERSQVMLNGSTWDAWRIRVPFLLVAMLGGLGAGFVIDIFEEALAAVTALAIFIPVVMDMGGNAGTQSSTIFARGIVTGQVRPKNYVQHFLRELLVGGGMAVILGLLVGGVAAMWQGSPQLGVTVGLALALTVLLAVSLGFIVPIVLIKLGFDQAAGSDPVITTIKDITGLLIYFGLARLLLGV
jgi:magnesium transporter